MKRYPQCVMCKHLASREPESWTCSAFPEGIPDEIIDNKHIHDLAYPGDHGVRWEAKSEELHETWEMLLKIFGEHHPEWAEARRRALAEAAEDA